MSVLIASLPEEALQRLLDGQPLPEVARDPRFYGEVIREDGEPQRIFTGDPK